MLSTYILTHNRPKDLERVLNNIMRTSTGVSDFLCIVVDDSTTESNLYKNQKLINKKKYNFNVIHKIPAEMICPNKDHVEKQFVRAKDEIGWLRNIILRYHTTYFENYDCLMIDDDMDRVDINSSYREAITLSNKHNSFVGGLNIYGIDSRDTISRLERFLDCSSEINSEPISAKFNLKQALFSPQKKYNGIYSTRLSGGGLYLHGELNTFPRFPNCYNESWLFCYKANIEGIPTVRMHSSVLHDPSIIDRKTTNEMISEQKGIFLERVLFYSADKCAMTKKNISELADFEKLFIVKHPVARLKSLSSRLNLLSSADSNFVWQQFCKDDWGEFYSEYKQTDWQMELESSYNSFINRENNKA